MGSLISSRPSQGPLQARIFGGGLLVAAEEARSCAGGQHAHVLPRADAAGARSRPAFGRWRLLQPSVSVHLHRFSAGFQDTTRRGSASTFAVRAKSAKPMSCALYKCSHLERSRSRFERPAKSKDLHLFFIASTQHKQWVPRPSSAWAGYHEPQLPHCHPERRSPRSESARTGPRPWAEGRPKSKACPERVRPRRTSRTGTCISGCSLLHRTSETLLTVCSAETRSPEPTPLPLLHRETPFHPRRPAGSLDRRPSSSSTLRPS